EPVTTPRRRFDISYPALAVGDSRPDLAYAVIQPVFEIHVSLVAPDEAADLLAAHQLPGAGQEQRENFEGLRLEPNRSSVRIQLATSDIELKLPELKRPSEILRTVHVASL